MPDEHNCSGHDSHTHALDKTGASVSVLCLLHCLLLPVLAPIIPFLEAVEESELSHLFFAILIVPIAVLTFDKGYREHKKKLVPTLGYIGLGFICFSFFIHDHGFLAKESLITSIGSILLVVAHILNIRLCTHRKH